MKICLNVWCFRKQKLELLKSTDISKLQTTTKI